MCLKRYKNIPICERRDDETRRVPQVLVPVPELGVADVGIAIPVAVVPTVPELGLPHEGQSRLDFVGDEFSNHVPGVHVDGANGHDLLPVPFGERTEKKGDQIVELSNLFLVVVLDGVLVALFKFAEGDADLVGPPDLGAAEGDLGRVASGY